MEDLVSIIVPIYNAEKTIQRCLESIINQTYSHLEVILVDDGSLDSSWNICKNITEGDSRFTIIQKENGGVSSARNCGIIHARGKYLMFLDSDDWLARDMIEYYVNLIREYDSDIVIGGLCVWQVQDHSLLKKTVRKTGMHNKELWNTICDSPEIFGYSVGKIFRKDIIDANSIRFNEKMYAQEDLDFCLSYYEAIDCFYLTDYTGYQYMYEPGKRIPPYCDFMRNQLKLLNIAEKKCKLHANAYNRIQQRISGYIYMMFYEAKDEGNTYEAYNQIKMVDGLDGYLKSCRLQGEQKYIVFWYLKGKYKNIFRYFQIRRLLKRILRGD